MNGIQILLADRNKKIPPWSTHKLESTKFHRNESELPRYVKIEKVFAVHAKRIVRDYAAGRIDKKQAMAQFREHLNTAETHAFISGKRASGSKVLFVTPAEQKMLNGRHSRNMRYFSNFLNDIRDGKTRMPIMRRATMYAKSLWSLYNRGQGGIDWTDPDPNARYMWVLDFDAEHCEDCMRKYKRSIEQGGYTFDELIEIGFPGEGCACMTHCRCHIEKMSPKKGKKPDPSEGAPGMLLKHLLDGNNEAVPVGAAGLAKAYVSPASVAESIHALGSSTKASVFLENLPETLNLTLLRPASIEHIGESIRVYNGYDGSQIRMERGPNGLWYVVDLIVGAVSRGTLNKH